MNPYQKKLLTQARKYWNQGETAPSDLALKIMAEGFDPDTVRRVEKLLYLAEYKRRQSPPGVKIGPKNFGRDRRYPIVNRFRDPGLPAQAPDETIAPRGQAGTSERFEE